MGTQYCTENPAQGLQARPSPATKTAPAGAGVRGAVTALVVVAAVQATPAQWR
jgi:hypothetical protein